VRAADGRLVLAINTVVTGNPVYPVALGSLPAIEEPQHASIHQANLWNNFGDLWEEGWLRRSGLRLCRGTWLAEGCRGQQQLPGGRPGPGIPFQLGMGLKLFLVIPFVVLGRVIAWRAD